MAKKDVFEKLNDYYSAIMDIDKIKKSENIDCNNECRLDRVLVAIKDIPKKDLLIDDCDIIIDALRHSIVELYKETYKNIEQDIFNPDSKIICRENVDNKDSVTKVLENISNNEEIQKKFADAERLRERGIVYGATETD